MDINGRNLTLIITNKVSINCEKNSDLHVDVEIV